MDSQQNPATPPHSASPASQHPDTTTMDARDSAMPPYAASPVSQQPDSSTVDAVKDQHNGKISLICGIVSLFALGIILGPIAIFYGGKSTTSQAKWGRVLGWIGLLLTVFWIIITLYANLSD